MTSKEVRKLLKDNGCYLKRQGKGDHEIWFSPITGKTFPVPHPKRQIPVGTLKSIKRLAGI
mgnify:CR=1 FL=1